MPLLEIPGHSRVSLGQSLVGSLLLSPGSWCSQGFFVPSKVTQPVGVNAGFRIWSGLMGLGLPTAARSQRLVDEVLRSPLGTNFCSSHTGSWKPGPGPGLSWRKAVPWRTYLNQDRLCFHWVFYLFLAVWYSTQDLNSPTRAQS